MKNQMDEKLYAILAKHGLAYAHGRMREAVEEAYELGFVSARSGELYDALVALEADMKNDPYLDGLSARLAAILGDNG